MLAFLHIPQPVWLSDPNWSKPTLILLNLGDVTYIDSSGIGELVSAFTAVRKEGGELKLLNLTQKIQDLLAITKLLTVFDVYENEDEALSSFA